MRKRTGLRFCPLLVQFTHVASDYVFKLVKPSSHQMTAWGFRGVCEVGD